jgi:hypothetical protein
MTSCRYIDLNSAYRDRNQYPNPSDFEVPIGVPLANNSYSARDPVSLAQPIKQWSSLVFDGNGTTNPTGEHGIFNLGLAESVDSAGIPVVDGFIGNATATTTLILTDLGFVNNGFTYTTDRLQKEKNYYVGASLHLEDKDNGNATLLQEARILQYKYLGKFPNPMNDDDPKERDVAQVTVDVILDLSEKHSDKYTIDIVDASSKDSNNVVHIFVPASRAQENAYVGNYLYNETRDEGSLITSFDSITRIVTAKGEDEWKLTDNYSIRKELPFFTSTGNALEANTTTTVKLNGGSSVDNAYQYKFLRVRAKGRYGNESFETATNEVRMISSYKGSSNIATVSKPFSVEPDSVPFTPVYTFEVLNFSYDQFSPLNYVGSVVSQQQYVCYEIELLHVILPNIVLDSGVGGTIAYYPFVYVQFTNSNINQRNMIISNNPNASKALFKAAVDDVSDPTKASFVKIDGDGTCQTVKFKPNDNMKFSVFLPNGELFTTQAKDTESPTLVEPSVQISALFSIKRIS